VRRSPLFQVMLALQNVEWEELRLPDLQVTRFDPGPEPAKFDLALTVHETPSGLDGELSYARELYEPATITRISNHFQAVLRGMTEDRDRRLSELALLSSQEQQQILREWNRTELDYRRDRCVHELIEEQLARTPDAVAVVCGDRHLTCSETSRR